MNSTVDIKPIPGAEGAIRPSKLQDFVCALGLLAKGSIVVAGKRDIADLVGYSSTHALRAIREGVERGYIKEVFRGTANHPSHFLLLRGVDEILAELEEERKLREVHKS